ncbi:MAG: GGDEF domain-containing protein [Phycisphaerales bacterium]|nr:GGDEF domain-containing protein [Phycisphaerales bacterium]
MSAAPDRQPRNASPRGSRIAGDPTIRVVVVGHTALHGVDAALRLDGAIELIRARTPLTALGELADPIDDRSPRDAVVVVSPEAVPPERTSAFASAVRRIVPHARLLTLAAEVPHGFDGRLNLDDPTRPLAAQVKQSAAASTPPPATPAPTPARDTPPPSAPAVQLSPALPTPASAMALGQDAVAAALEGARLRLGASDARFIPSGTEPPADAATFAVPVTFAGRTLGRLIVVTSADTPAPTLESLAAEAEQLGAWVALSRQQAQLRHAAFTDDLTGAWNRRYFGRFLAAAIEKAAESRHSVTLLAFDVDNFKTYNDRFGHAAGDEILVEIVRLLNACIRSSDRVCRIGGDEFAVIFHDPDGPRGPAGAPTSPRSISDIVKRFQKQIVEHRFPKLGELAPGSLTVSGGMATFPWDGRTVQQLLDRADELALQSKKVGKNHITLGPGAEKACSPS